jgi:ketosteroid isomerase-like protein
MNPTIARLFMIVSLTGPDSDYAAGGRLTMAKVATAPGVAVARPTFLFSSKSGKMARSTYRHRGSVMTKAEIEKAIRKLYAARVVGNIDAIMGAMAPDVDFALAGDPKASPVVGRLHGSDKLRSHLTKLVEGFRFNAYDIVSVVVEGSSAAVHARANITSAVTGQTVDMELADFIEFKDGSVNSFLQFCDTAMAAKLVTKP